MKLRNKPSTIEVGETVYYKLKDHGDGTASIVGPAEVRYVRITTGKDSDGELLESAEYYMDGRWVEEENVYKLSRTLKSLQA